MKRIVSCMAAVLTAAAISMNAFAARDPQPYGQNKDNWCWAAAVRKVAEYNSGLYFSTEPQQLDNVDGLHRDYFGIDDDNKQTADGGQRNIVMYIKGDDKDAPANDNEIMKALHFASYRNVDVGKIGTRGTTLSDAGIERIKQEIQDWNYVIGGLRLNTTVAKNHVVVVTDYNAAEDKFKVFDPWDMTDEYYSATKLFNNFSFLVDRYYGKMEWFFYSDNIK